MAQMLGFWDFGLAATSLEQSSMMNPNPWQSHMARILRSQYVATKQLISRVNSDSLALFHPVTDSLIWSTAPTKCVWTRLHQSTAVNDVERQFHSQAICRTFQPHRIQNKILLLVVVLHIQQDPLQELRNVSDASSIARLGQFQAVQRESENLREISKETCSCATIQSIYSIGNKLQQHLRPKASGSSVCTSVANLANMDEIQTY